MSGEQHFPFLSRPVGPLVAVRPLELWQANLIRKRVLRMFLDEANGFVESAGVGSEIYNGYVRLLYLLRTHLDAAWWLQWAKEDDAGPIITALATEYAPIMGDIPPNESELYESEQAMLKQQRANPAFQRMQWGQQQALY